MLKIMMQGEPTPLEDAKISVLDHGFLFGDSVYEVIRTKEGKLFAPRVHLKRLRYSADHLRLELPWSDAQLMEELKTMTGLLGVPNCSLRLMVTRGVGPLSLDPSECKAPMRIIFGRELNQPPPESYREGVALYLSDVVSSVGSHKKGNHKTGNYLDNVRALDQAQRQGCHESLRCNTAGHISECTTSNVFWVKDGVLYTPSLATGILRGVTRELVLFVAERQGVTAHEGAYPVDDLLAADEIFITSTSREILPVSRVGDCEYIIGPVTGKLSQGFAELTDIDPDF